MGNQLHLLLLGGALWGCGELRAQTPPNVVLFLLDDMGYGDLGFTGALGYETPHINRLAGEWMFFSHFYSAQPISSASRAGLLTGCYPNRIGFRGALSPRSATGIHPEEETLAETLKGQGYRCGIVGKWHLGDRLPFLPLQNGFDDYLGLPYSNDMWPMDYAGNRVTPESNLPNKLRYPALPLVDGNETVRELWTLADQGELTGLYTERAVRFIEENRRRPFFLYIAHSMPHVPLAVSERFRGKSRQGLYGDVMMEIDWSVGEVMKALKEQGLDEHTLVIFTSDNGPWANFGNHAGSAGGLREGKATTFEGGQRVPCIVRWKGVVAGGSVCNRLASAIDLLPTLAAVSGASLPAKKIDGVNLLPLLLDAGSAAPPRTHFFYYFEENDLEAVRDERFKLVLPHRHRVYLAPGNDGFPGPTTEQDTDLSLYDLRRDPGERYDVKALYPEVVERLLLLAEEARKDLGDNLTNRGGTNRRPIGRTAHE
ncbi:MAG: sulfatase [Tannerellaceae bacterium]|jgi:arylsulfatase|nr:sulfatase [Tannerellaceae bacterium]